LPSRAVLRLTLACNNACLFCAQKGLVDRRATEGDLESALSLLRQQSDELTFVGGEPTLVNDLLRLVRAARVAGFAKVGLQSNGRLLARTSACRELADAGLTDIHLSLHGAQGAVHDYHVGVPGAFRDLLVGLGSARAAGLVVVVNTVLTRSNYRVLGELPPLLRRSRASGWLISVPRVAGSAAEAFDRLVPRLSLALPFALQSLEQARRAGLPSWLRGAPACLLGPLGHFALAEAPRMFGAQCATCASRSACSGVDARYLERFTAGELRPRDTRVGDSEESHLARMFVDVGELGPGTSVAPMESPQGTLVALGRAS
jgi:hypothetical protein